MTAVDITWRVEGATRELADEFVRWLQTGERPDGMFATDVFLDLSLPHWRIQCEGDEAVFAVRADSHPWPGEVRVEALDATARGFLLQFEERWSDGEQNWYCRELIHAEVRDGAITELTVYCTGDWDETVQAGHAAQVRLLRP